jgi:hypothetical protein
VEGQSGRSGFEDQLLLVIEALAVGPHQAGPAASGQLHSGPSSSSVCSAVRFCHSTLATRTAVSDSSRRVDPARLLVARSSPISAANSGSAAGLSTLLGSSMTSPLQVDPGVEDGGEEI